MSVNAWHGLPDEVEVAALAGARQAYGFLSHVVELVDLEQDALLYAATHKRRVYSWWNAGHEGLVAARIRGALAESHRSVLRVWDQMQVLEEEQ